MRRLTTTRRGLLRGAVAAGLSLAAMAGLWLLFAPLSLGGSFSYAVVSGDSMEPGLTTDDVVLLRGSHDYAVGDVVAYRHPQLGPVLHRIIAFEGARMVLQGDNRGSPDSYRPVAADVIGRSWVTIPAAGGVVRELQRPRNAILLVVAALALALWSRGSLPAARQRGRRVAALGLRSRSGVALFSFYSPSSRTFFSALIVLALLSGGAFLFARVDGPTQTVVQSFGYEQRGTFSYGEVVGEGVYDADLLTAPQPLFRTLQDRLPFDFTYDLTSPRTGLPLTNVTGSYEVVAEVRREDGWSRTFQLQPPTLFAGSAFASSVVLDLAEVDRRLDAAAEATGIAANLYRVAVIAGVRVEGELGGCRSATATNSASNSALRRCS